MQEFQENLEGETEGESVNGPNEMTFTLKRSGKTIRRLSAGRYLIIYIIPRHMDVTKFFFMQPWD